MQGVIWIREIYGGIGWGGGEIGFEESEPNGDFWMLLTWWELGGKNWVCLARFLENFLCGGMGFVGVGRDLRG
jgi:hypothetical protein